MRISSANISLKSHTSNPTVLFQQLLAQIPPKILFNINNLSDTSLEPTTKIVVISELKFSACKATQINKT